MTEQQMSAYQKLQTVQEKANFLLAIGITAGLDIEELDLTYRACVGDVRLPITGATELTAIERATVWLKEKAQPAGEAAQ